jgi:hypothetical protein
LLALSFLITVALPLALFLSGQRALASTCACTIFTNPTGQSNFQDAGSLELGVKFIPGVSGSIGGIRFYKQGQMSGTHVGHLWTSGGSPLATATFSTETASGWQRVSLSTPVNVTAGTTYIASVTMPDARYIATSGGFNSDVVNGSLTAPSSASSGGNGVFNTAGGSFPTSTFGASNYWVDIEFYDTDTPNVTTVSPTDGAASVTLGETVTATFDQTMMDTSFNTDTFIIADPGNNVQSGAITYDNSSKSVSFVATNGFVPNTTYTATLKGGSGTAVKNGGGVALAADYSWSFTTAASNPCPCTLKDRAAPEGSASFDDNGGGELGVKIKASTNGYITAVRIYKPLLTTETTHDVHVWDAAGTLLTTATTSNESEYGWQEVRLATPLRIYKNQLYVVSYATTEFIYQATGGGLTSNLSNGYLTAYADNSTENSAQGSGNRNGAFTITAGHYPGSGSGNGSYYWIDPVFSVSPAPAYPLNVGVTQPTNNAIGVPRDQVITAQFNRTLDATTVTSSTFRLFDSSNAPVSGTGTYDITKGVAKFTPTSPLAYGATYTAKLSASIADQSGVTLDTEHTWSFTVGSQLASDINQGPGGPLLVITSAANKYSPYYAEILRTEGLNYFDVKDISTVDAGTLNNYTAVVLAEMPLSQSQADMLGAWVNTGGNLVAMRPDSKLASLLGLTNSGSTRTNQYMLIDTGSAPGSGLVGETIQFKGTADNYTASGASTIATFYSDSSTGTGNPAVTSRNVGSNGGTAAAFGFDLAKSVIALHQGNQAWVGQNRDSIAPNRPNDLFFGAKGGDVQPDWVDLNKIHIPQADEQQRLLANMLIQISKDKRPLPRFWYLPGDYKAALLMAGDDHNQNNATGTEKVLSQDLNNSATDCSVADWQCVRASHYVYTAGALTNARAAQYVSYGFEIGDHVSTTCGDWVSFAALSTEYANDLAAWHAKFTSLPNQTTHRYHCYVWKDWDSQPIVEGNNGIRYDLNYVAYPASWIGSRSPLITGSGMNMRLTDSDGDMLDMRQGVTNFDNQVTTATNINATLDNAIGANGYYGIFGSHYDMTDSFDATLYNAAKNHNVPMVSSQEALTWLDGRNSSTFNSFGGANGQFSFSIAAAVGANNLQAMLPTQDAAGTINQLTRGGQAVSYQTQSVKGVQYAVFKAMPGSYQATYSDYNPNGGGSSGGTGSSGGGGGTSKKSDTGTTATPTTTETPGSETPATTPGSAQNGSNSDKNTFNNDSTTKKHHTNTWKWIGAGAVLVLAGGAAYLFIRYRRSQAIGTPGQIFRP